MIILFNWSVRVWKAVCHAEPVAVLFEILYILWMLFTEVVKVPGGSVMYK